MKIVGTCTIKKIQNGKVVDTITHNNIVNKLAVERLFMDNQAVFDDNCKIAISSQILPQEDYEITSIDNILAIGEPRDGGREYIKRTSLNPIQAIYKYRFLFPAVQRTINTICIVPSGSSNNDLSNITNDVYSYFVLAEPLIQETTSILDFDYLIYIDWSGNQLLINPSLEDALSKLLLADPDINTIYYQANQLQATIISSEHDYNNAVLSTDRINGSQYDYLAVETLNTELLKRSYVINVDLQSSSPRTINKHLFGIANGRLEAVLANNGTARTKSLKGAGKSAKFELSSLSPVYSQNTNSISLLYNPNNLSTSDWKPIITTDDSYAGLPTIYSIQIETGGGEGVATYTVFKTNYSGRPKYITDDQSADFGSEETDWVQRPMPLVQTSLYPYLIESDRNKQIPFNDKWIYRWTNDTLWVSGDLTKVALWQIFPELTIVNQWDLGSQIKDIATDPSNEFIYVCCTGGFFQINVATDNVTTLSTDRAMAVDVGLNGAVFAVLINNLDVGRLASSINANWDVTLDTSGIMIADWKTVLFIRIDKDDPDYKLGILEYRYDPDDPIPVAANLNNEWFSKVHFWDNVANYQATVDCTFDSVNVVAYHPTLTHPYNTSFVVKDGIWIFPQYYRGASTFFRNVTPGVNNNFIRKVIEDNPNNDLFQLNNDGDPTLGNTNVEYLNNNIDIPTQMGIAAYQFSLPLRNAVQDRTLNNSATFAIINSDIFLGYLVVAIGGSLSSHPNNTSYLSTRSKNGVGYYEIAADNLNSTVTFIRAYKQTDSLQKYIYTTYADGEASEAAICLSGNVFSLSDNTGIINFTGDRLTQQDLTNFVRGVYDSQNTSLPQNYYPLLISTLGAPHIEDRTNPDYTQRYGWDDINSVWTKDPLAGGKPMHTSTDPLIDGLSISWTDLDAGNQSDLVAGHFYNFIHFPQAQALVNDGSILPFQVGYSYYLRPVATDIAINGTIASNVYVLPEATSDPDWLTLDHTDLSLIEINIDGYAQPATLIDSGSPSQNEVLLVDALIGSLEFNPLDDGKIITGSYWYLKKISLTEIL